MPKTLDELFEAYDKRKEWEEKAAADKAARAGRERDNAFTIFRQKVIPPLRELSEQIRAKGHEANVIEALDADPPSVIMEFTPAKRPADPQPPTMSRITYSWHGGEVVEALAEVARSASRDVGEKGRLVDVNPEWTTRRAVQLVEAALKNH